VLLLFLDTGKPLGRKGQNGVAALVQYFDITNSPESLGKVDDCFLVSYGK
jgi:hypothetical protein